MTTNRAKITDLYNRAVDTTGTAIELAAQKLTRPILRAEIDRRTREDEALAALRALGDDGTALRQAVALAACGVTDDALEHALARWAREGTL